jgi:hypothetical protein
MKKILFICLIFSWFSMAQEQTITIGNTELKLGSDLEVVLDVLDNTYYVEEDSQEDNLFMIWDSTKRKYNYGVIKFDQSNKLISINKFWSTAVNDSHSQIFEQIIKLVGIYKTNGEITVDSKEIFEPNYKAKTLNFIQGNKTIELTLANSRITLKEILKVSE